MNRFDVRTGDGVQHGAPSIVLLLAAISVTSGGFAFLLGLAIGVAW